MGDGTPGVQRGQCDELRRPGPILKGTEISKQRAERSSAKLEKQTEEGLLPPRQQGGGREARPGLGTQTRGPGGSQRPQPSGLGNGVCEEEGRKGGSEAQRSPSFSSKEDSKIKGDLAIL